MGELAPRLGDLVDDYCPRCHYLLNHAIASMVNGQVVKVICQTCHSEHAYQHGEGGKKKAGPRTTLFDQVLAKSSTSEPTPEPATPRKKEPAPKQVKPKEASAPEPAGPKKKTAAPARYISRHKSKPPRSGR